MDYRMLIGLLLIVVIVIACRDMNFDSEKRRTLDEHLLVNRFPNGSYELIPSNEAGLAIYASTDPLTIFEGIPRYEIKEDTLRVSSLETMQRTYFGYIEENQNDTFYHIVTERLIPLEGQVNSRDLGGITTRSGRVTKWGQIFRSGQLALLTNDDLKYLESLGIQTVVDFRNDIEISKQPDRIPSGAIYVRAPVADKEGAHYRRLKKELMYHKIRSSNSKAKFIEIMEAFVDTAAIDFKPVFDHLSDPDKTPLLFHCAGGKDRTGAMAAIILMALDVDQDVIRNEYLMSNFYRHNFNKSKMRQGRRMFLGRGTLENAFIVQTEYIDAVFDIVNNKYNGIENYLQTKFDISPQQRKWLIEKYTYDPHSIDYSSN